MRKSCFTETQIVAILKAHDAGTPTAELARKHGIHPNTLRQWRAKCGGTDATDVAKVRSLTEENGQLKRIVAELHLDNHAYKLLVEKTDGALATERRGEGHTSPGSCDRSGCGRISHRPASRRAHARALGDECHAVLLEARTTLNTGNVVSERTVRELDRIV